MVAKAETVKHRSISSASRIDVMSFISNAHVRFWCYAVVCIIWNVSVGVFTISELNIMIALTSALCKMSLRD